ncbi:MAG TPA: hypothetical protein VK569_08350, partial [Bacteroidota bacterium]|nr:hypothetical protein [Bacteroidota bacterium]
LASGTVVPGVDSSKGTRGGPASSGTPRTLIPRKPDESYGVTNLYPQIERPRYDPQHGAGRGRVWILTAGNTLRPVYVRTGITDGRSTEVSSDFLKAGDRIVLGAEAVSGGSSSSPLAAGGGGPGGGPR